MLAGNSITLSRSSTRARAFARTRDFIHRTLHVHPRVPGIIPTSAPRTSPPAPFFVASKCAPPHINNQTVVSCSANVPHSVYATVPPNLYAQTHSHTRTPFHAPLLHSRANTDESTHVNASTADDDEHQPDVYTTRPHHPTHTPPTDRNQPRRVGSVRVASQLRSAQQLAADALAI